MRSMQYFVGLLASFAVVINTVGFYLQINKIWIRKHEKVVAESISIAANTLYMSVQIPFFLSFLVFDFNIPAAVNSVVIFFGLAIMSLIGTGLWVKGNKQTSVGALIKRSLKLERKESAELIKDLTRPSGSEKIIDILKKLAAIDDYIDEQEVELIKKYANEWDIADFELQPGPVKDVVALEELRNGMMDYLDISPPAHQVEALGDLMRILINIDNVVEKKELMVLEELEGLINNYISDEEGIAPEYEVLVVPQSDEQYHSILELLPNAKCEEYRGGKAFCVGTFYSKTYAIAMCKKYADLGLFSTL
ncbi:MAG: hypothetical protein VX777_01515 [Chlamydiota bacterium]|nr:hypothetical protein [Chlamydiota bacterium]